MCWEFGQTSDERVREEFGVGVELGYERNGAGAVGPGSVRARMNLWTGRRSSRFRGRRRLLAEHTEMARLW